MDERNPTAVRPRRLVLLTLAAVAVAAGVAAIYGIAGRQGNAGGGACAAAEDRAAALEPLAKGEVAALMVAEAPAPVPDLAFADASGAERKLSDWRGKTVLLNLWATWCAPCRHEMPALDRLQAELGGADFEVIAINIDTGGDDKPKRFLDEVGVERLAYYADHSTDVFRELKKVGRAFGLPTTLLIDRNGCELGHMAGPAQWDSEDAKALIRAAIAGD